MAFPSFSFFAGGRCSLRRCPQRGNGLQEGRLRAERDRPSRPPRGHPAPQEGGHLRHQGLPIAGLQLLDVGHPAVLRGASGKRCSRVFSSFGLVVAWWWWGVVELPELLLYRRRFEGGGCSRRRAAAPPVAEMLTRIVPSPSFSLVLTKIFAGVLCCASNATWVFNVGICIYPPP